jgi:TRAP-type C4-dicarboxylate transport system substrate-binding protein
MLGLGADKGLRGIALFMAEPTAIISRTPIRHLEDFKGKKLRIFASPFQSVAFERLGVTPVAMSLGDVLPALQQGAIDGAIAGMGPFTNMHFNDAAKYITLTNQPAIFIIADVNQKWFDSLPSDLQKLVEKDASEQAVAINSFARDLRTKAEARWTGAGGELIKLPPDEQAKFMDTLSSVGQEVSAGKPALAAAYKIVTEAALRTRQVPGQ